MYKTLALMLGIMGITTVNAVNISPQEYQSSFKGYNGCFILYDVTNDKIVSKYNPKNRCSVRMPADSTFKVALSLMAFNQGLISESTVFKWDGKKRGVIAEWDHDQTPASWIKNSVVWVSQQITPQLGYTTIKHYLAGFNYGNQDFSGDPGKNNGLTNAWLSSSLKISANEQLEFLTDMLTYELPINRTVVDITKKNMYQGKLANGASYYAKTGSGWRGRSEDGKNEGKIGEGWWVGFVESGTQQYVFVTNLTNSGKPAPGIKFLGGDAARPIALKTLNKYFE